MEYVGQLTSYNNTRYKYYFKGEIFTLYTNDFKHFYTSTLQHKAIESRIMACERRRDYFFNLNDDLYLLKKTLGLPKYIYKSYDLHQLISLLVSISEDKFLTIDDEKNMSYYNAFISNEGINCFTNNELLNLNLDDYHYQKEKFDISDFILNKEELEKFTNELNLKKDEEVTEFCFENNNSNDNFSYIYHNFYPLVQPLSKEEIIKLNKIKNLLLDDDLFTALNSKIDDDYFVKSMIGYYGLAKGFNLIRNKAKYSNRFKDDSLYEFPKNQFININNDSSNYKQDTSYRYIGTNFDMFCYDKIYRQIVDNETHQYEEDYSSEKFYLPLNQKENIKTTFNHIKKIFININSEIISENFIKMMGLPYQSYSYCKYFNFKEGTADDFINLFEFKNIEDNYFRKSDYIFENGKDNTDYVFTLFKRYLITNGIYISILNSDENELIEDSEVCKVYLLYSKDKIKDDFLKIIEGDSSYFHSLLKIENKKEQDEKVKLSPSIQNFLNNIFERSNGEIDEDDLVNLSEKSYTRIANKFVKNNIDFKIKELFSYLNEGISFNSALDQLNLTKQDRYSFCNYLNAILKAYFKSIIKKLNKQIKPNSSNFKIKSISFLNKDNKTNHIQFFFNKYFYIYKIGEKYYIDKIINDYLKCLNIDEKKSFNEYNLHKDELIIDKNVENNYVFKLCSYLHFLNKYSYKKFITNLYLDYILKSKENNILRNNLIKLELEFENINKILMCENPHLYSEKTIDVKKMYSYDYISNYLFKDNDCCLYYTYNQIHCTNYYVAGGRIFNAYSSNGENFFFKHKEKKFLKQVFKIVSNKHLKRKEEFILALGLPSYYYSYLMSIDLFNINSDEFLNLFKYEDILEFHTSPFKGNDLCFRNNIESLSYFYESRNIQHKLLQYGVLLSSTRLQPFEMVIDKDFINHDLNFMILSERLNNTVFDINPSNKYIIRMFNNINPDMYYNYLSFIYNQENEFLDGYNLSSFHDFVVCFMGIFKDMYITFLQEIIDNCTKESFKRLLLTYIPIDSKKMKKEFNTEENRTLLYLFVYTMFVKYIIKYGTKHYYE